MDTDWNWRLEPEYGGELRAVADIGSHWLRPGHLHCWNTRSIRIRRFRNLYPHPEETQKEN
jgi:hypothetical protein